MKRKPKNIAHIGPARDHRGFKAYFGASYRNSSTLYPPPPKATWDAIEAERKTSHPGRQAEAVSG